MAEWVQPAMQRSKERKASGEYTDASKWDDTAISQASLYSRSDLASQYPTAALRAHSRSGGLSGDYHSYDGSSASASSNAQPSFRDLRRTPSSETDARSGTSKVLSSRPNLELQSRKGSSLSDNSISHTRRGGSSVSNSRFAEALYTDERSEAVFKKKGNLFALMKTVEQLETSWERNDIDKEAYAEECWKLINQFKSTEANLTKLVTDFDVRRFVEEYNMFVPAATRRLLEVGVPATVEHKARHVSVVEGESYCVNKVTHHFISLADALELNRTAVDQLVPYINDVLSWLDKLEFVEEDFTGIVKLKEWLRTMNDMRAYQTITEDQRRELLHDVNNSYHAFTNLLEQPKRKNNN